KVLNISQQPWERVMEMCFERRMNRYRLIAEIMGRRSNLVLTDDDYKIRGALKTITPKLSNRRIIMPGTDYLPPPVPDKISLQNLDRETFMKKVTAAAEKDQPWKQIIINTIQGISPLWAAEIEYAGRVEIAAGDTAEALNKMWEALQTIIEKYNRKIFQPVIIEKKEGQKIFAAFKPDIYKSYPQEQYTSANHLLATYYAQKQASEQKNQLRKQLRLVTERELKKAALKEKRQQEDLSRSDKAEQYRLHGELILAHLHMIGKKSSSIELPDIYSSDSRPDRVHISLDPRYSAVENAQQFFKKYRKLQKSKSIIQNRLTKTIAEKKYLENVLFTLEKADLLLLEEIKEELIQSRYIKKRPSSPIKKQPARTGPLSFLSSTGFQIFVGRSNLQNEELTFKKSSRNDIWFHAQNLPGTHVVVRNSPFPPDEHTLLEAAALAAYFSKGNPLPAVTVDYTEIKNVRRAPGKKPGMALYSNFKSTIVSPDSPVLQRFKIKEEENN
ncbi:MAG: NFACT RNA binding domain-containing protein, partial [Dethiobacteria bacterium]